MKGIDMLVLARKKGEEIYLDTTDGKITIQVIETRPGMVRFGIDAPKEIKIVRDDVKTVRPDRQRKHGCGTS